MKYFLLFDDGLGIIEGVVFYFKLKENVKLQFFKFRLVFFVFKGKIVVELNCLERIGELEKVEFFEWVIFIVLVFKFDGIFCICGDYRMMINFVFDVQEYLM